MRTSPVRPALAALLTLASVPAAAQGFQVHRSDWATEITRRPLTLAQGMYEIAAPVNFNLSDGSEGEPIFLNPSVMVGVSDRWTIGVRHFLGVCLGGEDNGCPDPYNDISFDSILSLGRTAGLDLALGFALNVAPIIDDTSLAGEGRLIFRAGGGAVAFTVAPTLNFGVNDRDGNSKRFGVGTNFGTYNVLVPEDVIPNREWLLVPATLQLQLGPTLGLAFSAAVNGPLNPEFGDFADYYTIPVGLAAVLAPMPSMDLGAAITFPQLLGEDEDADERYLSLFVAFRR
jgi:hypothetical protein